MSAPQIYACCQVFSVQLSPDEITSQLRISPTKQWDKGDHTSLPHRMHTENGWQFRVPERESWDVDAAISELIDILEPSKDALSAMISDGSATCCIECVVTMTDQTPSLHLSAALLNRLSRLGADLDIDIIVSN